MPIWIILGRSHNTNVSEAVFLAKKFKLKETCSSGEFCKCSIVGVVEKGAYTHHAFFIHSSIDRLLDCLLMLTVISNGSSDISFSSVQLLSQVFL